jgi:hypothetical protein
MKPYQFQNVHVRNFENMHQHHREVKLMIDPIAKILELIHN